MLIFNTIKQKGCSPKLDENSVIKNSDSDLALNGQKYYSYLHCQFYTKSKLAPNSPFLFVYYIYAGTCLFQQTDLVKFKKT